LVEKQISSNWNQGRIIISRIIDFFGQNKKSCFKISTTTIPPTHRDDSLKNQTRPLARQWRGSGGGRTAMEIYGRNTSISLIPQVIHLKALFSFISISDASKQHFSVNLSVWGVMKAIVEILYLVHLVLSFVV